MFHVEHWGRLPLGSDVPVEHGVPDPESGCSTWNIGPPEPHRARCSTWNISADEPMEQPRNHDAGGKARWDYDLRSVPESNMSERFGLFDVEHWRGGHRRTGPRLDVPRGTSQLLIS